jgi:hypothetical protein
MQAQQSSRAQRPKLPPKAITLEQPAAERLDPKSFRIKQLKSPKAKGQEPPRQTSKISKSINYNRGQALAFNRYNAVDLMSVENLGDPDGIQHRLDDSLLVVPKYTRIPKESGTTAATSNQNYITFEENVHSPKVLQVSNQNALLSLMSHDDLEGIKTQIHQQI